MHVTYDTVAIAIPLPGSKDQLTYHEVVIHLLLPPW